MFRMIDDEHNNAHFTKRFVIQNEHNDAYFTERFL